MLSRNVLSSCNRNHTALLRHFPRSLATEVTHQTTEPKPSPPHVKKSPKPDIYTAVVLNRAPILTKIPTSFEKAYYTYQARIRRALHNPFPYDFYFKQGSLLETRFNMEEKRREKRAFGPQFAEDEVVDGEKALADKAAVQQLSEQEGEGEELMPRKTPADIIGDVKSLDRKGKRNLYLLLLARENGKEVWRFPQGGIEKGDLLHQAALKDLHAECGENMDTWIVSRNPIGVYKPKPPQESENEIPQSVLFFYKAHIMAGQVKPRGNSIRDFAWLTKQEIEARVEKDYWESIRDILSEY